MATFIIILLAMLIGSAILGLVVSILQKLCMLFVVLSYIGKGIWRILGVIVKCLAYPFVCLWKFYRLIRHHLMTDVG